MMTETVVHVTTLEQWKSVLDVWFAQGYRWNYGSTSYHEEYFEGGQRFIRLISNGAILQGNFNLTLKPVEYSEFMAQEKEDNKMATYYVTQEQLDLIESAKGLNYPLTGITAPENLQKEFDKTHFDNEKEILRYLGGDETVEFKVKEQLYRLYLVDVLGQRNYFTISNATALPDRTVVKEKAFVETLEEIKKWQTPAWEIEEVKIQ